MSGDTLPLRVTDPSYLELFDEMDAADAARTAMNSAPDAVDAVTEFVSSTALRNVPTSSIGEGLGVLLWPRSSHVIYIYSTTL